MQPQMRFWADNLTDVETQLEFIGFSQIASLGG